MRKDQKFNKDFSKSNTFENILFDINNNLYPSHQKKLSEINNLIDYPIIHIIGAPRSGTTLLNQFLISSLDIGYINNLIATFWKVPIYGIKLSRKLLDPKESNYNSTFGRTKDITEPHEFGYFWNYWLKYTDFLERDKSHESKIDWENLKLILNSMANVFDKPMIFKSFLLGFHAQKIFEIMPKTIFIFIKRDFYDNANSILKFRKKVFDSEDIWVSIMPKGYEYLKKLNKYEQITSQIKLINDSYDKQMEGIDNINKIEISYEEFCKNPYKLSEEINNKIKEISNIDINIKNNNTKSFNISSYSMLNKIEFKKAELEFEKNIKQLV